MLSSIDVKVIFERHYCSINPLGKLVILIFSEQKPSLPD